ncbi:hypothetical protein Pmani_016025 [Petrolisthes manimaculis]|uniref:CUB domain-containing protein n=1 Tax=Petrolisthes manimaculis TaxID=1843537 RepID=A0AAE1UBE5_9EUCA|nr:hypothetical protein Pmani_016025 [Petrolisthes manimaculis]
MEVGKLMVLLLFVIGVESLEMRTWGSGSGSDPSVVSLDCGKHSMAPNTRVTIQTPNYPNNYDESYRCQWEIYCNSVENTTLTMVCPDFELEDSTDCTADRLIIKDHDSRDVICGDDNPDGTTTVSGFIRLTFWSNIITGTTAMGFRCHIWCHPKPGTINLPCIC